MARPESVRAGYVACGPREYYRRHGGEYRNPHEPVVAGLIRACANDWRLPLSHVLDLAAGSGEATLALEAMARPRTSDASGPLSRYGQERGPEVVGRIDAIDPYTAAAYEARVGRPCEAMTFEQIAAGGLRGRTYSLIVCSFALHLVEISRLPRLCHELAAVADQLLILTPHKRPTIDPAWGWTLTHERTQDRVRARRYVVQPAAKGVW